MRFTVACFLGVPALIYYLTPTLNYANRTLWLILLSTGILSLAFGYPMHSKNLLAFHPTYIACLDKFNQNHTLQSGLTSYRDAKPIRFLSQTNLKTVAYDEIQDTPKLWMNSITWYQHTHFNFIIWRNDVNNPPARRATVIKKVGLAKQRLTCDHYTIWLYKPNQLDPLLQHANYHHKGPFDAQGMYKTPNHIFRTFPLPSGTQSLAN